MSMYYKILSNCRYLPWTSVDFVGTTTGNTDLSSVTTSSITACQSACNSASTCIGFNFNGTACWLKSSTGSPSYGVTNTVSYLKNVPGYTTLLGYDIDSGSKVTDYPNTGALACYAYCNSLSTCNSFFIDIMNTCGLKTRTI